MPYKNEEDRKAHRKRYYQQNRERLDAQNKAWFEANKDRHRGYTRKWRENNADKIREYSVRYQEENLERIREANRKHYQNNKDAAFARAATRRARKRGAFVERVSPQVVFDRDEGVCQICKEPIGDQVWHIDHVIPLAKGGLHCYANVQLSHGICNLQKHSKIL